MQELKTCCLVHDFDFQRFPPIVCFPAHCSVACFRANFFLLNDFQAFLSFSSRFFLEVFKLCCFSCIPIQAFVELYDIKKDPDQLTNIVKKVAPKFLAKKHSRLVDLATCAGDSCREVYSETEDLGL